jgi:hypothetical protein
VIVHCDGLVPVLDFEVNGGTRDSSTSLRKGSKSQSGRQENARRRTAPSRTDVRVEWTYIGDKDIDVVELLDDSVDSGLNRLPNFRLALEGTGLDTVALLEVGSTSLSLLLRAVVEEGDVSSGL